MSLSRRGIFGLFAAAPVAAAASQIPAERPAAIPAPEFFVGQIRAVFDHFEARPIFTSGDGSHSHTFQSPPSHSHGFAAAYTQAVAVARYEQWDGNAWRVVGEPTP